MDHHLPLLFLLPTLILHFTNTASLAVAPASLQGCKTKCGNIDVPYPFGLDQPDCFISDQFKLFCNESFYPPKLFTSEFSGYEITDISLLHSNLRVQASAFHACYNSSGDRTSQKWGYIDLGNDSTYVLSLRNSFYAIGCPNHGYYVNISGYYVNGCVSACSASTSDWSQPDSSCSGVECCESSIPRQFTYFEPYTIYFSATRANATGPVRTLMDKISCSYVFLADSDWFEFDTSYRSMTGDLSVPVVVDWAIRDRANCSHAHMFNSTYACRSAKSVCIDSDNGDGYRCNCSNGYQGNPYIENGCQDIDECTDHKDFCHGQCTNTDGSYICSCPSGYEGNPKIENGCRKKDKFTLALKVITGVSMGVFLVAFSSFWIYLGMKKKKLMMSKQRLFEQNGGVLLQQQMRSTRTTNTFRIYSEEELKKATDNFSDKRVLGRGGHGIVYKGILEDGTIVAIKKSKLMEEHETNEFAKEMLILSQINHKNVVKLFGCCLEVEVPMLVYEYISHGTLYHYIHDKNFMAFIPSDIRFRIAAESADALAYMHSSASPPILHGDVKSANVLLDDNFMAKVSDFGASKLAPNDEAEIATLVQGTCGYLDPEYLLTCQLTDKSDVYSFAVIILELLTRKKALCLEGPESDRSLASCFRTAKKEGRFLEILDGQVRDEIKIEVLEEIGDLVMRCLSLNREERPTMREVSERLEMLRRFQKQTLVLTANNETKNVLIDSTDLETKSLLVDSIDVEAGESSMYHSSDHEVIFYGSGKREDLNKF